MLRDQAIEIWTAGVAAVASDQLVREALSREGQSLSIRGEAYDLALFDRIVVLGAGKAGAGMARAVEAVLGHELTDSMVTGWVNVPADCVVPLRRIVLHAARPAGLNEPTEEGVLGTRRILELARGLGPRDLAIVLISGGGSALLPAPIPEITLADKQALTKWLMQSGASISELNAVRKKLSLVKGGGLARAAANAHAIHSLIISDVIDDPLDVIASGPTVPDTTTIAEALRVVTKYRAEPPNVPDSIRRALLARQATEARTDSSSIASALLAAKNRCHIIGNNGTAQQAAARKAEQLGFRVLLLGSNLAGEAAEVGRELADLCRRVRAGQTETPPPLCVLGGGEPVVQLVPTSKSRKGGRNQEVALSALVELWNDGLDRIAILSGGTDGEDGPTDAAGAVIDEALRQRARSAALDPRVFLEINNSYPFFEQTGGLLKTGPTHTNVMDLRVALIA
jgi:hydroxypyruvate reductase